MVDLPEILTATKTLTLKTGAFIREEAQSFKQSSIEHKGLNDMVSYVDREAEKMLVRGCQLILPEADFLTEEGTITAKKDAQYRWIIDPLDGTTNFIHGLPVYAVSIALMKEEEVVMGIVYEINLDECFYAIKGSPAYCNDHVIKVTDNKEISRSLLATGFPYADFEDINKYLQVLSVLMRKTHGLRRMGSAAVDLAYVAAGRMDGYFEYNLNAWDVAGGALIVQQAGGLVTDFEGGNNHVFGREILAACTPEVHSEMLKSIEEIWDKK